MPTLDNRKRNVFQSKIEKVFIELHNYSFFHASIDQQTSRFFGRKELLNRLKSIITNSSTETGVYLITGNRGVGKSSLVAEVARKTSLIGDSWGTFKYLALLTILVISTQLLSNELNLYESCGWQLFIMIICLVIMLLSFGILGYNSIFRIKDENKSTFKNSVNASIKELGYFKYSYISPQNDLTLVKLVLILSTIEFLSIIGYFSCFQLFFWYIFWIGMNNYQRYCYHKVENKIKQISKNETDFLKPEKLEKIRKFAVPNVVFASFLAVSIISSRLNEGSTELYLITSGVLLLILLSPAFIQSQKLYNLIKQKDTKEEENRKIIKHLFLDMTFISLYRGVRNYITNHNRIFLKINLGHEVLKERDVLRLIARTLDTSFINYYKSFKHTFIWKLIIVLSILSLSYFTHKVIYEPIFQQNMSTVYIPNVKNSIQYEERIPLKEINRSFHYIYNYILDFPKYLLSHSGIKYEKNKTNPGKLSSITKKYKTNLRGIDYSMILTLLLAWGISFIFYRSLSNHINTPHKIKKRLKNLNEAITSEITNEKTFGGGISHSNKLFEEIGLKIGIGKSKKTMVADEREIEKELTDILDEIQEISFLMRAPEFIIVFDELDKVEPEQEGENAGSYKTKNSMFSLDAIRERQSTILKLLINLKFFLTNAKAKFIFIAGREMYDIYLADTSDRNNFIGSIFHDVINVPSFLSDHSEDNYNDPTSLTEEFVCRSLIPKIYTVLNYNLCSYRNYLQDKVYRDTNDKIKINKIISILQQFIIYLAYVSKGAPKKLVQQFESFIEVYGKDELNNRFCVKTFSNTKYFLAFDYQDQYAIGMIAHIVNPVFLKLRTNSIQKHSDKLLVSTLFMLEYIYKFHNHSFSWKDIAVAPEMLEINKAPELRSMMSDLLNFLSQFHIEQSTSGFNDFKFDNLISQEISFLSKIYEEFSAMYNFSMDESLAVKEFYIKLLENELKKYKDVEIQHSEFVHATSSLHVRLGDLYFYDDELEKANVYYKNGIQTLRYRSVKELSLDQLHLLVKNMMKLGLVYEKRKLYDFAFLTYGELTKLLIESREVNIHEIGLSARLDKTTGRLHFIRSSNDQYITEGKTEEQKYHDYIEVPEFMPIDEIKSENIAAKVQPLSFEHLSSKTQALLFKNSTFEGIKMLYLPLLAKFQILEKSHFGGIQLQDLEELLKEFRFMKRMIDHKQRNLLIADFYAKIGEILYYKNKSFIKEISKKDGTTDKLIYSACFFYKKAVVYLLNISKELFDSNNEQNVDKFDLFVDNFYIHDIIKKLIAYLIQGKKIFDEKFGNQTELNLLARILSDWANLMYSCDIRFCSKCHHEGCLSKSVYTNLDKRFFNIWLFFTTGEKFKRYDIMKKYLDRSSNLSNLEAVLIMYSFASNFYKRSNLHKRSALQINKILIVLKSYLRSDIEIKNQIFNFFNKKDKYLSLLTEKAIKSIYQAYDSVNILEKNEMEKKLSKDSPSFNYLLLDSKIDRVKITHQEIELLLLKNNKGKLKNFLKKYYTSNDKSESRTVTSQYEINYSVSARIYRLRFKAQLNYYILSYFGRININDIDNIQENLKSLFKIEIKEGEDLFYIFEKNILSQDMFDEILSDSIFCYREMIKLGKTSGESYFFNHSFFGSTYLKLAEWTRLYELYKKNNSFKKSKINSCLEHLIGENWQEVLSSEMDFELSTMHYNKAKETHTGGRAYKNLIDSLYYMKDDYNDRVPHFDIALERFTISTNKREENVKSKKHTDSISNIQNYI